MPEHPGKRYATATEKTNVVERITPKPFLPWHLPATVLADNVLGTMFTQHEASVEEMKAPGTQRVYQNVH